MKIFTWILRLALGGLFIAAAIPKIVAPHEFAIAIYHYQMVPHLWINGMAIFLPWLELALGACLIIAPPLRRGSAFLLLVLLVIFTTAIGAALYRGIDITCGCFSVSGKGHHIGWLNLARNAALMVAV